MCFYLVHCLCFVPATRARALYLNPRLSNYMDNLCEQKEVSLPPGRGIVAVWTLPGHTLRICLSNVISDGWARTLEMDELLLQISS